MGEGRREGGRVTLTTDEGQADKGEKKPEPASRTTPLAAAHFNGRGGGVRVDLERAREDKTKLKARSDATD